jgi:hypothetical protein
VRTKNWRMVYQVAALPVVFSNRSGNFKVLRFVIRSVKFSNKNIFNCNPALVILSKPSGVKENLLVILEYVLASGQCLTFWSVRGDKDWLGPRSGSRTATGPLTRVAVRRRSREVHRMPRGRGSGRQAGAESSKAKAQ